MTGSIAGGAAIRTVDGGQNTRAIENFLAKTLGLGGALQAVFPLVGGLAFVQLLGEAADKLYEMHQRAEEAGKALQAAMDDAHAKTSLTIDDLAIQADKLQLNIDKLKGHPGNGLQLGLDEAKKSADELLSSLTADRKEIEALFKETHVGPLDAWLSGRTLPVPRKPRLSSGRPTTSSASSRSRPTSTVGTQGPTPMRSGPPSMQSAAVESNRTCAMSWPTWPQSAKTL